MRTHGKSKTIIYTAWTNMRQRCENPNTPAYHRYGGRGISVCQRWQSFDAFMADMGEPPAGATLERINNDGDYSPANCQWASRKQQANNRSSNRYITYAGRTQTLAAWADELGLDHSCIAYRVARGRPIIRQAA